MTHSHKIKGKRFSASESKEICPNDLKALRCGDHLAYDKIYLCWRKPLYNLLYKLTRSAEEAEDITQDVFINLWENRKKIDPDKEIKYYLYMLAKQAAIKHFRRRKVHNNYVSHSKAEEADNEINSSDQIVIVKELELLKEIALSRMPAHRRKIYRLNFDEGMNAEEIAKAMNIKKETVYSQLSAARRELRDILPVIALFLL